MEITLYLMVVMGILLTEVVYKIAVLDLESQLQVLQTVEDVAVIGVP